MINPKWLVAIALIGAAVFSSASPNGTAACYPWGFQNGDKTSKATALEAAQHVARRAGFASVSGEVARKAWLALGYGNPVFGESPTTRQLSSFGRRTGASVVLYGSVSWHTRSILVGAGPKTISTATVTVHVFNVKRGTVTYSRAGEEGRSDEKANGYKIAADILVTPIVSVVSGGPATPREQRAVQIALGKAYQRWIQSKR